MKGFLSKLRRKLAGSNDTTVNPDLDPVVDSELSEVEPLPAVEQAKPNSGTTKSASDPEDLIRDGFHPDLYVFGSEVQDPVNRDPAEAVKWTEAAAASGDVKSQYITGVMKLGSVHPELEDFRGAQHWLATAARNGSTDAMFQIGNCFEHGIGTEQDYEAAAFNYFHASQTGHVEATFALGTLYEHGLGVEQNFENARDLYRAAARKFHPSALFNLGRLYQFGWGVTADYAEAHKHYLLAAERGHLMCQFLVGQALLRGVEGTKVDVEEGASWMMRAAESGFAEAQAQLGFCYLLGQGVEQDHEAALHWSLAAAEQGHAWAQYRAAHILIRHGPRREAEFVEAVKWLVRSFNQPQEEGERRHEIIKDDFNFLQSALPADVFEAACSEAATSKGYVPATSQGGHA